MASDGYHRGYVSFAHFLLYFESYLLGDWRQVSMQQGKNIIFIFQELRSREEELTKAQLQQKHQEEFLRKREQEIAEREIELVERELNIMILQQVMNKPMPHKRKGKFKRNRLQKLLKAGGKSISEPSGVYTVKFKIFVRKLCCNGRKQSVNAPDKHR